VGKFREKKRELRKRRNVMRKKMESRKKGIMTRGRSGGRLEWKIKN
jgi:hypothetical protein